MQSSFVLSLSKHERTGATVLKGVPSQFCIKAGNNPHTRTGWGRRKKVDSGLAARQWQGLRQALEGHGVQVHLLPAIKDEPGMVFPANAGFLFGRTFYLSNLNPARAGEKEHYRRFLAAVGCQARDLPSELPFEGQADFFPVGDPSGEPEKAIYLFTYGRLLRGDTSSSRKRGSRWVPRLGIPPYRLAYGFRSDRRILPVLQTIVGRREILDLELVDEAHYHGDTVLCPFGPHREFLLACLEGLSDDAQAALRARFKDRLVPLSAEDGRRFAANSFQVYAPYFGEEVPVLLMPDGLTNGLYETLRARGVIPCPVDVSEFLEKGGGAVKCLLLDLAPEAIVGYNCFRK
jgi:N-dimethylarginine dimethylaminohydrolase